MLPTRALNLWRGPGLTRICSGFGWESQLKCLSCSFWFRFCFQLFPCLACPFLFDAKWKCLLAVKSHQRCPWSFCSRPADIGHHWKIAGRCAFVWWHPINCHETGWFFPAQCWHPWDRINDLTSSKPKIRPTVYIQSSHSLSYLRGTWKASCLLLPSALFWCVSATHWWATSCHLSN